MKGIGTDKPMRDMQTETEGGGQSEKTWVREKVERVLITAMHLSEWHLELTGTTCS